MRYENLCTALYSFDAVIQLVNRLVS